MQVTWRSGGSPGEEAGPGWLSGLMSSLFDGSSGNGFTTALICSRKTRKEYVPWIRKRAGTSHKLARAGKEHLLLFKVGHSALRKRHAPHPHPWRFCERVSESERRGVAKKGRQAKSRSDLIAAQLRVDAASAVATFKPVPLPHVSSNFPPSILHNAHLQQHRCTHLQQPPQLPTLYQPYHHHDWT